MSVCTFGGQLGRIEQGASKRVELTVFGIVLIIVVGHTVPGQWMEFLVENVVAPFRLSVLDVIIDGQRHTLDRVLEIWLRHGTVVQVDGGTRAGLLRRHSRSSLVAT
jgi:hypothetical protein